MTSPTPPRPAVPHGPRPIALIGAGLVSLAVAGIATVLGSGIVGPAPIIDSFAPVAVVAPAAIPAAATTDSTLLDQVQAATPQDPGVQYVYVTTPAGEGREHEHENEHDNELGDH